MEQEMIDRVRRIETRVTRIGNAMGIDVGGAKPTWNPRLRRLELPTSNCSLAECLNAVPQDQRHRSIDVYVGDELLTTFGP